LEGPCFNDDNGKENRTTTMSLLYQDDDAQNTLADFGLHPLSAPLNPNNDTSPHDSAFLHLPSNPPFSKPISDPDLFVSSLYNYYYKRGLGPIVASGIVELVSLFFTLYLSYVIGACLDWNSLRTCHDETSCHENLNEYWIDRPLGSEHSLAKRAWIVVYCWLFTCYGMVCVVQFGYNVMASLESKLFMEEVLGVPQDDLVMGKMGWGEIVERMEKRSDVVRRKLGGVSSVWGQGMKNNKEEWTTCHLIVAQRIMRRENFMIAFFNLGLLDLTLPNGCRTIMDKYNWMIPFPLKHWLDNSNKRSTAAKHDKHIFYSKSIEWSIYFCVLNYMFNHSRKIRPVFYQDPSSLQKRFILCGVAHFFFMPFLLFFVTLHFFMLNVYDWQSTKEYLGPREWSVVAQWKFREFNELPHLFERRME
jgi:autophagy-related protein 9